MRDWVDTIILQCYKALSSDEEYLEGKEWNKLVNVYYIPER